MYQLVVNLLHPCTALWLLTGLAIADLWRRHRECRRHLLLVTLPYLVLTIMTIPAVSHVSLGTLEWQFRPLRQRPAEAESIVVLGGSVLPADATRARAELGRGSFDRCMYAVEVYRQGKPCPVLVSGGKVDPRPSTPAVGVLMGEFLRNQGIRPEDIIVEDGSLTTYENARETSKAIRTRGLRKVVLVTEALHMPRAAAVFRKLGIQVIAAPCAYRTTRFEWALGEFLPSPKAALDCQMVLHEWLGLAWYRLQGRL